MFVVKVSARENLINGFLSIKEMVYLNQRLKLLDEYDKLNLLGLKVMGIKTDCIFFQGDLKLVKSNFPMTNEIGNFKIEYDKHLPTKKIQMFNNKLIDIPDFSKPSIKTFDDELNTNIINYCPLDPNCCMLPFRLMNLS